MYAIIQIFLNEKRSPTSPGANPSPRKPNWHRLPNWESSTNLAPYKRSAASSRSPWSAKTSQMGVSNPATPKIYNFPPEIPPNEPNSERTTRPPLLALFTCICQCLPTPAQQPALLYTPALSSGTPGISTILPAQPKDHITNPNQPRHHGNTSLFLGGGEYPVWIYDMVHTSPGY